MTINNSFHETGTVQQSNYSQIETKNKTETPKSEITKEVEVCKNTFENIQTSIDQKTKSMEEYGVSHLAIKNAIRPLGDEREVKKNELNEQKQKIEAFNSKGQSFSPLNEELKKTLAPIRKEIETLKTKRDQLYNYKSTDGTLQKIASFIKKFINSIKITIDIKNLTEKTVKISKNADKEMNKIVEKMTTLSKEINELSYPLDPNSDLKDTFKEGRVDLLTGEKALKELESKIKGVEEEIARLENPAFSMGGYFSEDTFDAQQTAEGVNKIAEQTFQSKLTLRVKE